MKIVFHGTNASNFHTGIEPLLGGTHEIVALSDALDQPGERDHFASADVIVGNRLSPQQPRPTKVRLFHAPAAGTDNIDAKLLPAEAKLCNCFGHENAIAEYVIAALLLRHVPLADADTRLRNGEWKYWAGRPSAMRGELGDDTIGLLGFGHIGKAIAARAKAFGMRVVVANRSAVPASPLVDASYGLDRLRDFMGAADAVVTSLPLLDQTKGIIGVNELAAMRDGAVIVNVGRGPVIDEQAVYAALKSGRINAIIDTWYTYPTPGTPNGAPGNLPFGDLANVVMTPHMSGWTFGTIRRRRQTIADNINRLVKGEPLQNVIV